MKKTKTQKGITLVALIITIVVLLILAAVSISSIQNQGILSYAENAAKNYNQAQYNEQQILEGYFKAAWTQNGTTVTNGTVTIKVGTVVTGYDAGVDDYTGGWAVLGAENGKLLIVSTTNVQSNVELTGPADYLNEGEKLETICEKYGKGKYATGARSITVEDINRITGFNPNNIGVYDPNQTGVGTAYNSGKIDQYGNTVTFRLSDGKIYYKGDKAVTTEQYVEYNEDSGFILPDNTELDANGLKIKSTGYYYDPITLGGNEEVGISKDDPAYSMLFAQGSGNIYWLASKVEGINSGSEAVFGLRIVFGPYVDWYVLSATIMQSVTQNTCGARAVVYLESDVNIDSTGKIS